MVSNENQNLSLNVVHSKLRLHQFLETKTIRALTCRMNVEVKREVGRKQERNTEKSVDIEAKVKVIDLSAVVQFHVTHRLEGTVKVAHQFVKENQVINPVDQSMKKEQKN
mmetsp:Transcript_27255/g.66303  ORF Transcript_27255/g.66303 Transcript_27255/m.66303 type:complete len:110 (+) Transcript_27255:269-598(+)